MVNVVGEKEVAHVSGVGSERAGGAALTARSRSFTQWVKPGIALVYGGQVPSGWRPRNYVYLSSGRDWDDPEPVWHVPPHGDAAHLPTAIASHLIAQRVRAALVERFGSVDAALAETGISRGSLNNALAGTGQWSARVLTELAWHVGPETVPSPVEVVARLEEIAARQDAASSGGLPPLELHQPGPGRHRPPSRP